MIKLKNVIKYHYNIDEIQKTSSLINSKIDYNKFISWAKSEADKITKKIHNINGMGFQWSEDDNGVKLIIYKNKLPVGYVGLNKFEDGYKISTLGVKESERGKGIALNAYDYIINKTTLYSDEMQTPEARKLWISLFNKYNVYGYNQKDKSYFEVELNNNEIVSKNPKYELYSNKKNNNYLVAKK